MSKNTEELRAEIAQTRGELQNDVDALVDKVSPSHIAHRQTEKIRSSVTKMKDAVMGSTENVGEQTRHINDEAKEAVHNAPHKVADQTRGNPLAAGLIAFGAGLLASSLIPKSAKEGELVQDLKDKAEPLTQEITNSVKQVAKDMKEPATAAVEDLKDSAQHFFEEVKSEATGQAAHLQSEAKETAKEVKDKT